MISIESLEEKKEEINNYTVSQWNDLGVADWFTFQHSFNNEIFLNLHPHCYVFVLKHISAENVCLKYISRFNIGKFCVTLVPVTERNQETHMLWLYFCYFFSHIIVYPALTHDIQDSLYSISWSLPEKHGHPLWTALLLHLPTCVAAFPTGNVSPGNTFSYSIWHFKWWRQWQGNDWDEYKRKKK